MMLDMKKRPYILLMVFLVLTYLVGQHWLQDSAFSNTITTALAIIAGVAVLMEIRSNERINEAQLIMELNNQFITNESFAEIEWVLEKYFASYQQTIKDGKDPAELKLDFDISLNNKNRQKLVNYLVHLEGVAALVNEGVLRLNVITDLMAYRYFIAVNNPVVQETELLPNKDYYRGIFSIYDQWSKHLDADKIPMAEKRLK